MAGIGYRSEAGLEVGTELHGSLVSVFQAPCSEAGSAIGPNESRILRMSKTNNGLWDEQAAIDAWTLQVRRRGIVATYSPNKPLRRLLSAYTSPDAGPTPSGAVMRYRVKNKALTAKTVRAERSNELEGSR